MKPIKFFKSEKCHFSEKYLETSKKRHQSSNILIFAIIFYFL